MYRLYMVLKDHATLPTEEEVEIASGKKTLDPAMAAEYLIQLEKASNSIVAAFKQQAEKTMVILPDPASHPLLNCCSQDDWDQAKFEKLLAEWIAACDQPFEEVDRP